MGGVVLRHRQHGGDGYDGQGVERGGGCFVDICGSNESTDIKEALFVQKAAVVQIQTKKIDKKRFSLKKFVNFKFS